MRTHLIIALAGLAIVLGTGCKTFDVVTDLGVAAASAAGYEHADSAGRVIKSSSKAFEQFTPKQKHYIGRTVGVQVLGQYKVYANPAATRYVNVLGQTLAAVSDHPETYAGYRFLILDTEEVNGFAAPGGLIFVTRGLLRCCKTEADLAAVLAHEIGHVQLDHGMKSVKKGRFTKALAIMGTEAARTYSDAEAASLAEHLEDSVADMTDKLLNGYDRGMEYDADEVAVVILKRLGYNPTGLKNLLVVLGEKTHKKDSGGFGKTHPKPSNRVGKIEKALAGFGPVKSPPARQTRFAAAMKGI